MKGERRSGNGYAGAPAGRQARARARDPRARRVHRRARLVGALAEPRPPAGRDARSSTRRRSEAPRPEPGADDRAARSRCRASSPRSSRCRSPPSKAERREADIALKAKQEEEKRQRERAENEKREREKREARAGGREADEKARERQAGASRWRRCARRPIARRARPREQCGRAREGEGRSRRAQRRAGRLDPPHPGEDPRQRDRAARASRQPRSDLRGRPAAHRRDHRRAAAQVERRASAYDEAVQRAILKSSPLPRPDRPEQFQRALTLRFRPLD